MTLTRPILLVALLLGHLSACIPAGANHGVVTRAGQDAPPGAAPDSCWGKHTSPAIIETVPHQVMLQPAEILSDGTVHRPVVFKTATRPAIHRPRRDLSLYQIVRPQRRGKGRARQ